MTKTTEQGKESKALPTPTIEMVRTWVKRDTQAASYFLTMLLKYPDVLDRIADELFARTLQEREDHDKLDKAE